MRSECNICGRFGDYVGYILEPFPSCSRSFDRSISNRLATSLIGNADYMSKLKKIRQKIQKVVDELKRLRIGCEVDISLIEGVLKDNDYDEAIAVKMLTDIYHYDISSEQELEQLCCKYPDIESSTIESIFHSNGRDALKTSLDLESLHSSKISLPIYLQQKFPFIDENILFEVYLANDSNNELTESALHHMLFSSQETNEVFMQICQLFSPLLPPDDLDMIFQQLSSSKNSIDINEIVQFIFRLMNKRWDATPLISTESMSDLQSSTYQDLCILQLQYDLESHGLELDEMTLTEVLTKNDYDIQKAYNFIISQKLQPTFADIVKNHRNNGPPKDGNFNELINAETKYEPSNVAINDWSTVEKKNKSLKRNIYSSIQTAQYDQEHSLRIKANEDFQRMKECFKTAAILQRCNNCYSQSQEAIRKGRDFQASMIQANAQAAYHAIR